MKILATCCCKSLWIATLAIWANLTFAHSLGHDDHHPKTAADETHHHDHQKHAHDADDSDLDVMTLVNEYSLEGDDALIERAWAVLTPALEHPSPEIWLQAAWLAQAEHRFNLARKYVQNVIAVQPRNAQAWMLEAAIASVQGDHRAARLACQKTALSVAPVVSLACQLRAETDPDRRRLLANRVDTLSLDHLDVSTSAWVWSVRGDTYRSASSLDKARAAYERSFRLHPSVQTRAALADVLIAQRDYPRAVALLESQKHVPAIGVRYQLAAQETGIDIEQSRARLDQRFRHWIAQDDYRHAREMAMFYLDVCPDLNLAHKLAVENLRTQSEPEDIELLQRAAQFIVGKNAL